MRKWMSAVAVFLLMVFAAGAPVWAEENTWRSSDAESEGAAPVGPTQAQQKQPNPAEMEQMMGAMMAPMADMMGLMLEGMAKTVAKPEIAENFAAFTRNYYLALLARGFTEEEALKIVTASGLPSTGGGK
jgi:hypothetical protein